MGGEYVCGGVWGVSAVGWGGKRGGGEEGEAAALAGSLGALAAEMKDIDLV